MHNKIDSNQETAIFRNMTLSIDDIRLTATNEKDENPSLFKNLAENTLQQILDCSNIQSFNAGHLIVQQGDAPKYLYLVISGHVRTYRTNPNGAEVTIRMLEIGETCMEAAIFMNGPSPIAIQTTEASKLLLVPANFIKSLVLKDTQFANNMLKIVTYHYKNAIHQIDAMAIKTPVQRVGYYFLQQHIEQGANNMAFELPFKKSMIANHLGMSPETFSRALIHIKERNIDIKGDKIILKDVFALCHFCDQELAHECTASHKKTCSHCPVYSENPH